MSRALFLFVWTVLLQVESLSVTTERRRFALFPWVATSENPKPLGWALEERTTVVTEDPRTTGSWKVTVAWRDEAELTVELPWNSDDDKDTNDEAHTDDLATTLWDAAVAGAILCRSPGFIECIRENTVLELGSGIGLTGWVAGAAAASATLTDHDHRAVVRMNKTAAKNPGQNITARYLEWKDNHSNAESFHTILATDVAYYYYLLRPLMDTVRAHLDERSSMVVILGQANRQSQWDLYDNLKTGCYNQLTDEHEGPWPGQTRMLLYNLHVNQWRQDSDDATATANEKIGTVMPIAVILHETELAGKTTNHLFSEWDHVATAADRENIRISF
jgi:predicted nicotinamide N-methyase